MSNLTLPEAFKIVQAHEPVTADAMDNTCDTISCKNIKKLWVVLHHYSGGGDTDLVLTINESTTVAGAGTTAITETCPIWSNVDTATLDALTRQTDAITFTVDTTAQLDQIWILEWDPAKFSAGFDCFQLRSSGGNAANLVSVLYIAEMRYQSDVPPSLITD